MRILSFTGIHGNYIGEDGREWRVGWFTYRSADCPCVILLPQFKPTDIIRREVPIKFFHLRYRALRSHEDSLARDGRQFG